MFTITEGSTSIQLRSPSFNDTVTRDKGQIVHRSSSNYINIVRVSNRKELKIYLYKFIEVKKETVDDLRTFILSKAGLLLTWEDHLGTTRNGFLISNPNELITNHDDANYDVTLQFREAVS